MALPGFNGQKDQDDLFSQSRGKRRKSTSWSGFPDSKHKGKSRYVDLDPDLGEHSRLVDYFASGSFSHRKLLRHERRIQRNKALLMLFAVVIALFWVLYLVLD
jgi:hypothetical protein